MKIKLIFLSLLFFFTACNNKKKPNEIIVLSGASMRAPMEEIKKLYEKVSDDNILINYGGSGELCAQIKLSGKGDLFVAHDPFVPWAAKQGLIDKWTTLGYLDTVIVVPKNSKINNFDDLAKPGIRLGIGDTTYSTSGHVVKNALKNAPLGKEIMSNVVAQSKGHQTRCNYVINGALDAGMVWKAVAKTFENKLKIIPIPNKYIDSITSATYQESDLKNIKVAVGITETAKDNPAVNKFYDFLISNKNVFVDFGYRAPVSAKLQLDKSNR